MNRGGRAVGRYGGIRLALAGLLLTALPAYRPTALLAQCPDGAPPPCRGARVAAPVHSVAVLYFENATHDSADAYLADGLTEDIITRLTGIERLTVRSRYFVRRYRSAGLDDPATIGRSLGVTYLVTGSIRRAGRRLRVSAELIRANGGVQVWSRQFDQQGNDIFAIQEAVAGEVAGGIIGRLLPAERQAIAVRPTSSSAAFDAYLLGRYYWGKRTAGDLVRAADYFQRSIRADSNYALAWSGLADAYVLFVPAEYDVPGINPDSILDLAERSARRALALAPGLGEAYTSLGEILEYRQRWVEARASFERGVALSPLYPTAHLWYGYDLMVWNRWEDAVREMERARELDPLSVVTIVSLAAAYDGAERRDDATAMYAQARALGPDHLVVLFFASAHDLYRRDYEQLATDYSRLVMFTGADSSVARDLERRLRDPATRNAALRASAEGPEVQVSWRAVVLAALDGDEAMIRYLSGLGTDVMRSGVGSLLFCGCIRPGLRTDPTMVAVLARLGFPRP